MSTKVSRGEIEALCVLIAIGAAGCRPDELAGRLGLSTTLAAAVAGYVHQLAWDGLVTVVDERIVGTADGRARLMTRLASLGLSRADTLG